MLDQRIDDEYYQLDLVMVILVKSCKTVPDLVTFDYKNGELATVSVANAFFYGYSKSSYGETMFRPFITSTSVTEGYEIR